MLDYSNNVNSITDLDPIPDYIQGTYEHDPHAILTIQLVELIDYKFLDWTRTDWDWSSFAYSQEQYTRICNGFNARYLWHEISMMPLGKWKQHLLYKIKYELCPKYNPLYAQAEGKAGLNPLQKYDEYEKRREVYSDYPETLLGGNQDYATNGRDIEYERVQNGSVIDTIEKMKNVKSIDEMFLDDLKVMFSSLLSIQVNGY